MKLFLSAAILALSLAAAPVAFAQSGTAGTTGTGNTSGNSNQPTVKTDDGATTSTTATNEGMTDADKKFYSDNKMFSGFFTDDSMSTMRSDEELAATWQAMNDTDRASASSACETVNGNRGAYSPATAGMCDRIGGLGK